MKLITELSLPHAPPEGVTDEAWNRVLVTLEACAADEVRSVRLLAIHHAEEREAWRRAHTMLALMAMRKA